MDNSVNVKPLLVAGLAALAFTSSLANAQTATIGGSTVSGLAMCNPSAELMSASWRIGNGVWGEGARFFTATKVNFHNFNTKKVTSSEWRYHTVGHPLSGTEYYQPQTPKSQNPMGSPIPPYYLAAVLEVWTWNAATKSYDYAGSAAIPHSDGKFWCKL